MEDRDLPPLGFANRGDGDGGDPVGAGCLRPAGVIFEVFTRDMPFSIAVSVTG
jgi:hypothetical protein